MKTANTTLCFNEKKAELSNEKTNLINVVLNTELPKRGSVLCRMESPFFFMNLGSATKLKSLLFAVSFPAAEW